MLLDPRDRYESIANSRSCFLFDRMAAAVETHTYSAGQSAVVNAVRGLYREATCATSDIPPQGGSCVFEGGHVLLSDAGEWYAWFVKRARETEIEASRPRIRRSSHEDRHVGQWEIPLPGLGCILVGKRSGNTWYQNEAHAVTNTWRERVFHGWDWILHKALGNRQIGALGSSTYSEKRGSHLILPRDPAERMLHSFTPVPSIRTCPKAAGTDSQSRQPIRVEQR